MKFTIKPELPASDINRARAWYAEKLGLHPVVINNAPASDQTGPLDPESELQYDTGTARFGVYTSPHAGDNRATAARLVVENFDEAIAELRARGVVFEEYDLSDDLGDEFRTVDGVVHSPDGEKTAWFKDSEGNVLALGSC